MKVEEFISSYSIACFFHFTDTRNLPSIRGHGLLTLHEIKQRGIEVAAPGGNGWSNEEDTRRGLDRYVHLCLINEHPMEYVARVVEKRLKETRFVPVRSEILNWEGIRFTAGVANKSGSSLLTLEEACESLDFEVLYYRTNWKDPEIQKRRNEARKYELLIPRSIPSDLLFI